MALGAGDPVGPVALAGTMVVASTTHLDNGPFSTKSGYELPLTNLATALALWVSGPGSISFDRVTGFGLPPGLRRVVVTDAVASSAVSLAMVLRARRLPRQLPPPCGPGTRRPEPARPARRSPDVEVGLHSFGRMPHADAGPLGPTPGP